MSVTTASASLPISIPSSGKTLPSPATFAARVVKFFRQRLVYRITLSRIEGYSDRVLADIGADRGIEEFARRAAGL